DHAIRNAEQYSHHVTIDPMWGTVVTSSDLFNKAREALKANAAALILAHNHPSGDAEPSSADRMITTHIIQECALMYLRVLVHPVIRRGEYVSFAERGWI
ncbi:hypothetical protein EXD76_07500, partial [BEV proteobacterium]|nr:hypothetical protein [Candidatus Symbiopectobacterium sp. Chty_BC]